MNGSTDQGSTTGRDGDGDEDSRLTTWHLVPAASGDTVSVRWTDLEAMRARIDDLEQQVERLETDLGRAERRRERTRDRYERLLDRRGAWGSSVPRGPAADDERPTARADGGTAVTRRGEAGDEGDGAAGGPLSRLLGVVAAFTPG